MEVSIQPQVRPCFVYLDKKEQRALFHGFFIYQYVKTAVLIGEVSGQISQPRAIVEFENGHVGIVLTSEVRFADSESKFAEYAWEGDE